ncbi:MAG: HAD family hydrolase [Deltaproteobacteria bacterium]|nr:HAD family hydrolase [Deltaproteobacteria bacterium]
MTLDPDRIQALCFDLGGTLIEFGPRQVQGMNEALRRTLEERLGPFDLERMHALRAEQYRRPYERDLRENDLEALGRELIQALFAREASEGDLAALAACRHQAFLEVIAVDPAVPALLGRLGERYRLALLSNYPSGPAIREGLDRLDLSRHFETIVVSGEVGFVKPHPRPFERLLEGLGLPAEACVYVGDNWLADIQGARRMGMQAILTSEHAPIERFEPAPGDHAPDARIEALRELETLLTGPPAPTP